MTAREIIGVACASALGLMFLALMSWLVRDAITKRDPVSTLIVMVVATGFLFAGTGWGFSK